MNKNKTNGFTIVELLTVVGILVIISSILAGILYSTLRGGNKTSITTAVAQNGNYVVSAISNLIISSQSVVQVGGVPFTDCTASPSASSISLKGYDGGVTILSCSGGTISSQSGTMTPVSLIDTNQVQIDSSSPCLFYCSTQISGDPYSLPIVGFEFTLTDKSSTFLDSKAKARFNSSASLRNFNP